MNMIHVDSEAGETFLSTLLCRWPYIGIITACVDGFNPTKTLGLYPVPRLAYTAPHVCEESP